MSSLGLRRFFVRRARNLRAPLWGFMAGFRILGGGFA
jgi:hypothetical protein